MYGVMVVFRFHASPSPFSFALPPSKLVSALLLTCPNLPWGPLHNVCPFYLSIVSRSQVCRVGVACRGPRCVVSCNGRC